MTNNVKELDIDFDVTFTDGVGVVDETAFEKNLPAGRTQEDFEFVDSYRDQVVAHAASKLIDKAPELFKDGVEEISIAEMNLGGNATGSITLSSDYNLVSSINVSSNDALRLMEDKAKEIQKSIAGQED